MAVTAPRDSPVQAARDAGADVVLLAGDTFDCHRLPDDLLARAASVIAAASLPVVVVLPGNHDPAVADAVYHRGVLAEVRNLHVLGITHDEAIDFPAIELEIWGRARLRRHDPVRTGASAPHALADPRAAATFRSPIAARGCVRRG